MKSGEQYLEEIKASTRPIHRRRILQNACNALPPDELTALYLQLPSLGGRALCKSAPYYKFMTARPRQKAAKRPQLQKTVEEDGFRFFESVHEGAAKKTLYVMFGGNGGQFLIPFSAALCVLPKAPKDVAAVFSPESIMFYVNGVAGMGRNAFEVARSLRARIEFGDYARVVVMGTSSGGFFAHRVAAFLEADVSISFAGVYPADRSSFGDVENRSRSAFDPICACRPHKGGRMINVFSGNNEFDYASSRKLKCIRPNMLELCLPHHEQHNVLQAMVNKHWAWLFFKMAFAEKGTAIGWVSAISKGYGVFVVRRIRQALGVV